MQQKYLINKKMTTTAFKGNIKEVFPNNSSPAKIIIKEEIRDTYFDAFFKYKQKNANDIFDGYEYFADNEVLKQIGKNGAEIKLSN